MKKYFLLSLIFLILILSLCSWVNPATVDTYTGTIYFISSDYSVTQLSGSATYFFDDYTYLALSQYDSLYNASDHTITGRILVNGTEYPCRMESLSGFQIQQEYYSNNYTRTTWVNYQLFPDQLPSSFDLSSLAPIFLVFLLFMLLPLLLLKGVLQ